MTRRHKILCLALVGGTYACFQADETTGGNPLTDASVTDSSLPIGSSTHTHSLDIASFTSGSAGSRSHSVNIAQFTSGSAGSAAVDVTMPYMQLLACSKN